MKPLLTILACLSVTACSDLGFDVRSLTQLERGETRWDRFGLESYVYAVERICFCPVEAIGPVRVRVESGAAVQRTYVATGDPVPESWAELFPTVEGLFGVLRDAYGRDAHEVHVTYDPARGYPTDMMIDYEEQVADEELGFRVTEPPAPLVFLPTSAR
jgi:hypothetical protein